ncbi:hypothetical protein [Clostridium phage A2]|uniref:hypothetical protein n=1 Tax=Enterococcus faecium TaxID=1352 RepID=UPI001462B0B2|nr:hypothetical protein [Enterococcus faecium]QGF20093.1 hypothetical protein CPAS15_0042 [Clostridium phage CPAS-15]WAB24133.1 hypothetical protein [Clostridium phage A2]WAB24210.1 hypothetical protein [Clostridium phage C2]WAB24287.1 hypothetical protein [Clostridium phage H1]WAB24364.1 hypothetical protein [Clostridium phage D1]WAB24441.1 hypothetical protein [Clostridium phage E1]
MDNHSLEFMELQSEYRELERRWHQFLEGHAPCEEEAIQVKKRMEKIKRTLRNLN